MKVLIIWAESVNRHSGGSTHFWGLLDGIKSVGCVVHAVCPRYGQGDVINSENVSYIPLPSRSYFSFLLLQIATVVLFPFWLIRHRPDIVYVRTCFLSFLMWPVCRMGRARLIVEVDAIVDEETKMRGQRKTLTTVLRLLDRLNYRLVDGLLCVTRGIRDEVIRRGAQPHKSTAIHNAARVEIMKPMDQRQAREQSGLPLNGHIVGFAGTFAPWQGLDLLIESAKEVTNKASQPIYFALMGQGQCIEQLKKSVSHLGLKDNFLFIEPAAHEEAAVFNSACDVTVIPIHDKRKLRYGISPLKFWDAISVGVPVLVPQSSELDDVLELLNLPGTFIPGDKNSLVDAILAVLGQTDRYKSTRMKTHEKVCEKFSWEIAARNLMDFYTSLKNPSHE